MSRQTVGMQLPCVVKLPLQQYLHGQVGDLLTAYDIDLEAARNTEGKPFVSDLIISCGYGRLAVYRDLLGPEYANPLAGRPVHPAFEHFAIADERFGLVGAISLVWVVDKERLGACPLPRSWKDLCREELAGRIVYTADEDLLDDLILPVLSKRLTAEELERFRSGLTVGLHPSEMMRKGSHRGEEAIFIMPYFFASMKGMEPGMELVWPAEGALSLPVFVTAKKEGEAFARVFDDPDFAAVFSANGKFPSALLPADCPLPGPLLFRQPDIKEID